MHLFDKHAFDYYPGQTVIVPPDATMRIDFPEASDINPTQCIALAIDNKQINKTINYLNEYFPKDGSMSKWMLNFDAFHLCNNEEITSLINKVVRICGDGSKEKDILVDLSLKELLVRIMQSQNLKSLHEGSKNPNNNPLGYVTNYIKAHVAEKICIDKLSEKACMSKATFYRLFKRELGISPNDFILSEKINKAKQLLTNPKAKVTAVSYALGFSDANYFIKAFKKVVGITPGKYQMDSN